MESDGSLVAVSGNWMASVGSCCEFDGLNWQLGGSC